MNKTFFVFLLFFFVALGGIDKSTTQVRTNKNKNTNNRGLDVVDDFDNKILDLKPTDGNRYIQTDEGLANCSCKIVKVAEQKLTDLWNGFVNKVKVAEAKIKNFTNATAEKIKADLKKANNWVKNETEKVKEDIQAAKEWIAELAKNVSSAFRRDWAKIVAIKNLLKNETLEAFEETNNWIHQLALNISIKANKTKDWLNREVASAEVVIEEEWEFIVANLDQLDEEARNQWDIVGKWVSDTANQIANAVEDDWKLIKNTTREFAKKVSQAFKNDLHRIQFFVKRVENDTIQSLEIAHDWIHELAVNISKQINATGHQVADDLEGDWEWIQANVERLNNETLEVVKKIKKWINEVAQNATIAFKNDLAKLKNDLIKLGNETVEAYEVVKDWVHDLAKNISRDINNTAHAIADDVEEDWDLICENYDLLSAELKAKLDDIEEWVVSTAEEIKEDVVDWAVNVRDAFRRDWVTLKKTLDRLDSNTKMILAQMQNWLHQIAKNVSADAQAAWNNTKKWVNNTIENAEDDFEKDWEAVVSGFEKLDNDTKAKWQQMNQWISVQANQIAQKVENVTDAIFDTIAGLAVYEAGKLVNRTAIFIAASELAFNRTKAWFKKFLFCPFCNTKPDFVCIEADNKQNVTFLNACYAKCGDLKIVSIGKCPNLAENVAFTIDNQNLVGSAPMMGKRF